MKESEVFRKWADILDMCEGVCEPKFKLWAFCAIR